MPTIKEDPAGATTPPSQASSPGAHSTVSETQARGTPADAGGTPTSSTSRPAGENAGGARGPGKPPSDGNKRSAADGGDEEPSKSPTATPAPLFSQILNRFLDNVNAGKAVADFGPGLVLAVPAMMLMALVADFELMPAERLKEMDCRITSLTGEISDQRRQLEWEIEIGLTTGLPPLPALAKTESGETIPPARTADCDFLAHREAEQHAAFHLAWIDRKIASLEREQQQGFDATRGEELVKWSELKHTLQTRLDALSALSSKGSTELAEKRQLTSFSANIGEWDKNLAAIAGLTVVLGVILSQVNRLVFFEGLFSALLRLTDETITADSKAERRAAPGSPQKQEQKQDLVSGYYRYAEGSINMSVAVLCFGLVLPYYVRDRLAGDVGSTPVAMIVLALLLAISSYVSYRNFRRKTAALFTR